MHNSPFSIIHYPLSIINCQLINYGILLLLAVLMTACDRHTVYNHYEHTPVSGWEKNDSLIFDIPPLAEAGNYKEEIGLRISGDYPFMGLHLIIEQTDMSTHEMRYDTLNCNLIDEQGSAKGRGVSQYQYLFHLTTLQLAAGTPLHIAIRHDMKREILPGITDIGVKLSRKSPSE